MIKDNFGLYIVATPIGNLKDISKRAVEKISDADIVFCENPKHSLKLLNNLGIKKKLISLHDYNEEIVVKKIGEELKNKKSVLISDAGSPLISDPGFKLIQFCIKNNIFISTVPGPNSIIPAIQLSGLPAQEFSFYGFFPKTEKKMLDFLNKVKNNNLSSVFFVSSHKIERCIKLLSEIMQNRSISVLKELTKLNEMVFRGKPNKIYKENLKGEFVIVVSQKLREKRDFEDINELKEYEEEVKKLLLKFSLTDVVEIVHKLSSKNKNKIYKWVLKIKKS